VEQADVFVAHQSAICSIWVGAVEISEDAWSSPPTTGRGSRARHKVDLVRRRAGGQRGTGWPGAVEIGWIIGKPLLELHLGEIVVHKAGLG
jgi:hypothetical protein